MRKLFKKENRIYLIVILIYLAIIIVSEYFLLQEKFYITSIVLPTTLTIIVGKILCNIYESEEEMKKLMGK